MNSLPLFLLLGLVLSMAPARATPVRLGPAADSNVVPFDVFLHPVTDEGTPEWANLPNAKAWYEFEAGINQGGPEGMILVLRGVLCMYADQSWVVSWTELYADIWNPGDPRTDAPEPATYALSAAALVAGWLWRRRGTKPPSSGCRVRQASLPHEHE